MAMHTYRLGRLDVLANLGRMDICAECECDLACDDYKRQCDGSFPAGLAAKLKTSAFACYRGVVC